MLSLTKMRCNMFFLLVFLLSVNVKSSDAGLADSWISFVKESRTIFYTCINNSTESLFGCLKSGSLELFDRITSSDVIPLTNTVRLIRYHGRSEARSNANGVDSHIDSSHNSHHRRDDNQQEMSASEAMYSDDSDNIANGRLSTISKGTWSGHVLNRFTDVFSTHVIQLDLDTTGSIPTGRARHRHQQMLPMMIFGVTALGMVMVPIGFQMLSLFAGKALLLSKLALLLASINGVKRVATSGVHYGLYHQEPHLHHVAWDRNDRENVHSHPRNLNLNGNTR